MSTKANAAVGSRRRVKIKGERLFSADQLEQIQSDANPYPLRVRRYDSLAEWCNHAEWWREQCGGTLSQDWGPWTRSPQFETFEDAWEAMVEGRCSDGFLAALERERDRYVETITAGGWAESRRRRSVWSEDGDTIDVDRVHARHEKPFRRSVAGKLAQVVRLGLDSTALGAWDFHGSACGGAFDRVGGLLAAVAETIERQGRSVEITLIETENNTRRESHYVHACTLKHAADPLDLARIGSVASPLFARIVCRITDIFDAGQYAAPVYQSERPTMAEELGLDAIVGLYSTLDSLRATMSELGAVA